jgi:hypothetical protein
MKKVTHRAKTTMKMILVAVTTISWVSVMNKLLKLKYIHHYFFLKFLTKKSRVLRARNTVFPVKINSGAEACKEKL